MKKTVIFCLLAAALASAQTKQRIAVLPSVGDMEPQKLILLTDKVREIATQNLPMEDFNILKQDVITKMIGEEELYKACKEGVCIGDLARRTNADYGVRCDVILLDGRLLMKFELYSVNEDAIFETFTDYNVKDFYGMLDALDARLPGTFKKVVDATKKRETAGGTGGTANDNVKNFYDALDALDTRLANAFKNPKSAPAVTTFVDSRDGTTYKKVWIGRQTWMAENLNYAAPESKCYKNDAENCEKYGRLYDWNTAMAACPAGYHLPTDAEWAALEKFVGGSKKAGKKLKSATVWAWKNKKVNGTDEYGFSALPGGYGNSGGSFYGASGYGNWWSATEYNPSSAWYRLMYYDSEGMRRNYNDGKTYLFSVRCVQD